VNTEKLVICRCCQNADESHNIKIADRAFENVVNLRCLWILLTDQNYIHEEIKSKLNLGNVCYHSVQNFIFSPAIWKHKNLSTKNCHFACNFPWMSNLVSYNSKNNIRWGCLRTGCILPPNQDHRINFLCVLTLQGACSSLVGWGTILQVVGSWDRVPIRWIFFNLPNPSSHAMALRSTQPLTEMSTRNLPGGEGRPARKADNHCYLWAVVWTKCESLDVSQPYGLHSLLQE
jgi:hypothetical protein